MVRSRLLALAGAQLAATALLSEPAPTSLTAIDPADGWSPRPTKGVSIEVAVERGLLRRATNSYIEPQVCGFETGNYDSKVLANSNTCYFNTDNSRVGVYGTFWETCWDNSIAQTQRCPISQCTSLTLLCASNFPYCYQALYDNGFVEWRCNAFSQRTARVALTYNGQPQQRPIVYTGGNGLSTGEVGPSSTMAPSTASTTSPTPTPIISPSSPASKSPPIGAIVGGVIGGLAVIALVIIGALYLKYKKRETISKAQAAQRAMAEQSIVNQSSAYPSDADLAQKAASGTYYEQTRKSYQSASTLVASQGLRRETTQSYSGTPNPRESFQTVSAASGNYPRRTSLQTVSSISDGPLNVRESFQTFSSGTPSMQHHSFHGYSYSVPAAVGASPPTMPMGEPFPLGQPTLYELPDEIEREAPHEQNTSDIPRDHRNPHVRSIE